MTQPSQIRYVRYFETVLFNYIDNGISFGPSVVTIDKIIFKGCPNISGYFRPSAKVVNVQTNQIIYSTSDFVKMTKFQTKDYETKPFELKFLSSPLVGGDIMIKVYHKGNSVDEYEKFRCS